MASTITIDRSGVRRLDGTRPRGGPAVRSVGRSVDVARHVRRIGERLFLRPQSAALSIRCPHLIADRCDLLCGQHAELDELALQPRERVASQFLRELAGIAVFPLIIGGGMRKQPDRVGLDQASGPLRRVRRARPPPPRRGRSRGSRIRPRGPGAALRSPGRHGDTDFPAVWSSTGTEIANLLFWIRKITGKRPRAAQFSASWNSPSLVAPSPEET